jgi:hypothetical protein
MLLLNACVIWKFDTLLTERNRDDVPNIAGRYVDTQGQSITIQNTEFSNTFIVQPPAGRAKVRATMENIAPNRFLVQGTMEGTKPGMPAFFMSVAEIIGTKITVYFFMNQDQKLKELADKHKVTYEMIGFVSDPKTEEIGVVMEVITAYESVEGVVGFFNDLFAVEGAQKVTLTKR